MADIARSSARLLTQVNLARAAAGSPPVSEVRPLRRAAHLHAADMARRDRLDHYGADGSIWIDRVEREGYQPGVCGETIAAGQTSPEQTVIDWLGSAGHRAILLDPKFIHMGGAVGKAKDGTLYWVADFAAPPVTILKGTDQSSGTTGAEAP